MGNISTWGGGSPSKSTLKSYVHDAAELEFSLFRLQESRKKLKEKLDEAKREDPTRDIWYPDYEKEICPSVSYRTATEKGEQEAIKKYRKDHETEYWGKGRMYGFIFLIEFLIIFPSLIAGFAGLFSENFMPIILFIAIISTTIYAKTYPKRQAAHNEALDAQAARQYREEIQRNNEGAKRFYSSESARAAKENPSIRERNNRKKLEYDEACAEAKASHNRKISLLQAQLSELDSAITRTTQDRERFYSVNIVPVDYRTIQCVFYLDHAFRNDLVDTVRQGIDRYELSEYRTAVLGGIYSIVSKLDQMTGLMRDLGHQLSSIQSEVSFMSNDLYNMAEEQSRKQTEIGNRILEESRLRRKVTEELNETAKRVERAMNI